MRKGQWLNHPPVFLRQARRSNDCDVRIEACKALAQVARYQHDKWKLDSIAKKIAALGMGKGND